MKKEVSINGRIVFPLEEGYRWRKATEPLF